MNPVLIIQRFAKRTKSHRFFRVAYRGRLVTEAAWKTDRGLQGMVWLGIGLMVFFTCRQINSLWASMTPGQLDRPPQGLKVTSSPKQIWPPLVIKRNHNDSLFALIRQLPVENPPAPHDTVAAGNPVKTSKAPIINRSRWQIQVQQPLLSEEMVAGEIAHAKQSLQAGEMDSAKQALQAVLIQDPHQVEALEGMLLISKKMGDVKDVEVYLERLRQEIPDYGRDGNVWSNQE